MNTFVTVLFAFVFGSCIENNRVSWIDEGSMLLRGIRKAIATSHA
jgi:hypothetical protein